VPRGFGGGNTEPAERARENIAGMIGDKEQGRSAVAIINRDRRGVGGSEQHLLRCIVHGNSRFACGRKFRGGWVVG
jgi:hypothetical protein